MALPRVRDRRPQQLSTLFEEDDDKVVNDGDCDDFEAIVKRYVEPIVERKLDEMVYAGGNDENNERRYPSPPRTPVERDDKQRAHSAPRRRDRVDNCVRVVQ